MPSESSANASRGRECKIAIGYLIRPGFWYMRYASEAASFMVRYAFSSLRTDEVHALACDGNADAIRGLESAGWREEAWLLSSSGMSWIISIL